MSVFCSFEYGERNKNTCLVREGIRINRRLRKDCFNCEVGNKNILIAICIYSKKKG